MAYADLNTVHNPSAGGIPPAAWGDQTRDNFEWLSGDAPHCSLTVSAAQSVASGTTPVDLSSNITETSDIGGMHTGSGIITVPSGGTGLYVISAVIAVAANVTGIRQLTVDINGAGITLQKGNAAGTGSSVLSGGISRNLVPGDDIKCQAAQTSGGNLDITVTDFSVRWVSRA